MMLNYVIPEGYVNAVMQKEVTKSVCASEMNKSIGDGVRYRYNYQIPSVPRSARSKSGLLSVLVKTQRF